MTLQRLVLDYRSGELVVRALYRTEGEAGPNTKAPPGVGVNKLKRLVIEFCAEETKR
jgi:hypothetical protein